MSEDLHILVVDDDSRMAKTLTDILKIKGYEAFSAHSGNEALEKMEEAIFDCVLSDVKMPDVNGVDLISVNLRSFLELDLKTFLGRITSRISRTS